MPGADSVVGVLLAGGLSRRMGGGDKCLRLLGGQTILARIIETIRPQVAALALNANGDPVRFASFSLPVVPDVLPDNPGPLAGVLTGLEWAAAHHPHCAWVATVPTDAPFLPGDLIARLLRALRRDGAEMACAASSDRHHPVCGLWPVALRGALRDAMTVEKVRKVDLWTGRYRLSVAEFPAHPIDPFFNTNRPEDLSRAETLLAQSRGNG